MIANDGLTHQFGNMNPLGEQFDVPRRKPSATKAKVRTNDKRKDNKRKKAARKKNRE